MCEKKQILNFYGRRKGRKLRQGRQAQIQEKLPRVLIPICSGEELLDPMSLFYPPVKDVWMEIGFGAGEHLAYHASTNPDIGFLGIEPFINGVASLLSKMERQDLNNVRLLNDDVRLLICNLASNSLGRVFILFPDPWPKKSTVGDDYFRILFWINLVNKCAPILNSDLRQTTCVISVMFLRW